MSNNVAWVVGTTGLQRGAAKQFVQRDAHPLRGFAPVNSSVRPSWMFADDDTSFFRWVMETSFLPAREKERTLLILTVGYIELLVNCLIKEHKVTGLTKLHQKVEKLFALGLIDEELHELLGWIRRLRNEAAHDPFFRLQLDDVRHLPSYWSKPEYFEHVCRGICGSLWNSHATTFSRIFGVQPNA